LLICPQDRGPSLYTDTLCGLGSRPVDVDAGWCPPSLYTQRGLGDQRAPSLTHARAGVRQAWVDEDRSDHRFLFIRNHSSKNPLVDMTVRFWPSWCCFLIQIRRTFPTDLLTSWVPWFHVTSPRLSQVMSPRLSLLYCSAGFVLCESIVDSRSCCTDLSWQLRGIYDAEDACLLWKERF